MNKALIIMRFLLTGTAFFTCTSCATLFNSRNTHINIITDRPANIIVNSDTLTTIDNEARVKMPRQREPYKITVFNDSTSKDLVINSKNSFAYFMDQYYSFIIVGLIGILVDHNNPRRYTYPRTVYVRMNKIGGGYLTYMPHNDRYRNNLKITPLRLLFSHPGLELSYERYSGKKFSTQISFASLYNISFSGTKALPSSGSGYQFSLEEKYFIKAPEENQARPYLSVETGYFIIQHSDYTEYNGLNVSGEYEGRKTLFYLTPKFGVQANVTGRLMIEAYAGLGFKYEERHYTNMVGPYDKWSENFWQVRIPLNIRVGLRF
jgi:hypothetical protein